MKMKKMRTFIIVNTIQCNPRLGTQTVSLDGRAKGTEKPSRMQPGFTSAKHIVQIFSKCAKRKKVDEKERDRKKLCDIIISTINEHHGEAFEKICDLIRVNTMKEVF